MEMHFHESQGSCVWRSGKRDLELGSDKDFSNIHSMYNKKKNKNKVKTTLDPLSYPSNINTIPHLWQISGGGGGPDPRSPPLDPRMFVVETRTQAATK